MKAIMKLLILAVLRVSLVPVPVSRSRKGLKNNWFHDGAWRTGRAVQRVRLEFPSQPAIRETPILSNPEVATRDGTALCGVEQVGGERPHERYGLVSADVMQGKNTRR